VASKTEIGNRALQRLGQKRVVSFSDNTPEGRALNLCYDKVLKGELEKHPWGFAIKRAQLAASTDTLPFGSGTVYPLPADFCGIAPSDPLYDTNGNDARIEGRSLVVTRSAPANLRYIALITDPNYYTALFMDALELSLAISMCEELTQSTTKRQALTLEYDRSIFEAKKRNAFDKRPYVGPEDDWVTVRG
jgi:hypothetical protein